MPKRSTDKEPSFEQAIDKLEDLIERIESGEVGLEEAIEQYEQGQALIKRCRGILNKAERRIAELTQDTDGQPTIATDGDDQADDE